MAGSGANGKMVMVGILLAVVVVGLAVADKQTDHFTKVKGWVDHFVGHASSSITTPSF
ncbi:MAG: hypothetical protein ABSD70_06745 [Terracidiphilus sp.]|jgi:hypothetical protein